jgi:hypothetical protein
VEQGTSQGCLLYSVCTSSVFRSSSWLSCILYLQHKYPCPRQDSNP